MLEVPLNVEPTLKKLCDFIKKELKKTGRNKVILGLSGGVDSAVSAALAVKALGPENVVALLMPYKSSNPSSLEHGKMVAGRLKIEAIEIPITPMVDAFFEKLTDADTKRRGNFMARMRMSILFDQSEVIGAVVLGTSNRTEILLGYGTVFGDTACAFNPLGELYKCDVYKLAEALKVPKEIIEKAPSADLWEGQTDEEELGLKYKDVDRMLYYMIEMKYPDAYLETMGFTDEYIHNVKKRVEAMAFKSSLPKTGKAVRE